jgi:hypothetical protein
MNSTVPSAPSSSIEARCRQSDELAKDRDVVASRPRGQRMRLARSFTRVEAARQHRRVQTRRVVRPTNPGEVHRPRGADDHGIRSPDGISLSQSQRRRKVVAGAGRDDAEGISVPASSCAAITVPSPPDDDGIDPLSSAMRSRSVDSAALPPAIVVVRMPWARSRVATASAVCVRARRGPSD